MNGKHRLSAASSPHICSPFGTRSLMLDVLIALIPALCMAVYFYGPRALILTAISVGGCEFMEFAYRRLMKKSNTLGDLSAAITGVLLAFVCPVTLPYWIILIGDFFAIIVVKQLFGGLGKNFLNPALAAHAFLMLCYPIPMTTWAKPLEWPGLGISVPGAVTCAAPLSAEFMGSGILPDASLGDMFVGNIGGCLGEVSALMLIIGGAYLLIRGVIRVRIPLAFIGTVAALTFLFPQGNGHLRWMLYSLLGGSLMLGAFFMATDYVTSPVTAGGELFFGVGCGLFTVLIRYFGSYPDGVSHAILIMNSTVCLLDKAGMPARFGVAAGRRKAFWKKFRAGGKGEDAS